MYFSCITTSLLTPTFGKKKNNMLSKHCFSEIYVGGWFFIFEYSFDLFIKTMYLGISGNSRHLVCAATSGCTKNQPKNGTKKLRQLTAKLN